MLRGTSHACVPSLETCVITFVKLHQNFGFHKSISKGEEDEVT